MTEQFSPQHGIGERAAIDVARPAHEIVPGDDAMIEQEAPVRAPPLRLQRSALGVGQPQRRAIVDRRQAARDLAHAAARARGVEIHLGLARNREAWLAMRQRDVTASVAGALLGAHEYQTPFGLYALKTGLVTDDVEESAPMRRGRLLEPVALAALCEERPTWRIEPGGAYFRDPAARLGATPDAFAVDPERTGFGIVQIKSVEPSIFRRKWRDADTGEVMPPLWIACQALVEAHLTGASWACIAAMTVGHGVEVHVVDVPLHAAILKRLIAETAEFWRRVAAGEPYDPDYGRDGALIAGLYADDNGAEVDLAGDNRVGDLLAARAALKAREADGDAAAKERKPIDAEILAKLGNAARGRCADGTLIEAKTVRRKGYEVKPSNYRAIKVKTGEAA